MDKIRSNLLSLTISEFLGRLTGFAAMVWLARVIEPEGFGIIGFATAFVSWFIIITNSGFDIYGTREIAKGTNLSRTAGEILSLKLLLSAAAFIILTVITFAIKQETTVKIIVIITGITIFSSAASFNWAYQGMEKTHLLAVRQLVAGVITLAGILLFVRSGNNLIIAVIVLSFSAVAGSLYLLYYFVRNVSPISLHLSAASAKRIIRKSLPLTFSSLMIAVYYYLDTVILNYTKSSYEVGIYTAAYKVFTLAIIPFTIILNSFFPSLSRMNASTNPEDLTFYRYARLMFIAGITISIILFFSGSGIIYLLFGNSYAGAAVPLSILSLNAAVISMNMLFGNPLIAWRREKQYTIAITAGAVVNIVMNLLLIPRYSYLGAAFATLLSEITVFLGIIIFFISLHGKFITNPKNAI